MTMLVNARLNTQLEKDNTGILSMACRPHSWEEGICIDVHIANGDLESRGYFWRTRSKAQSSHGEGSMGR